MTATLDLKPDSMCSFESLDRSTSNAVLASKDQPVPLDSPAEMETPELLATTEHLAAPAETPKSERSCCLCHPSARVCRSLAVLVHPAPKETMAHPETLEHLVWMADPAQRDLLDHPDSPDSPDALDRRDHPENPDSSALESDHQQADLERTDALDNPDSLAAPEREARTETMDHPVSLAVLATVAHPAAMENLASPEIPDNLALLEVAITAHRPVWLPDIKLDLQPVVDKVVSVLLLLVASVQQNNSSKLSRC